MATRLAESHNADARAHAPANARTYGNVSASIQLRAFRVLSASLARIVAANTGWHGQASKVTGCERAEVHGISEAGGNPTQKPGRLLRGLDPKQSRAVRLHVVRRGPTFAAI